MVIIPTSGTLEQNKHDIDRLVALCRDKDRGAQFQIYKLYSKAMYNTALRILKDEHAAEDAMQEAFLKAFTKLDSFRGDVTFGAWLKRIVVNESIDQLKKTDKRQETDLEPILYKTEDETTVDESFSLRDLQMQQVRQALQQLKDSYRTVLTLLFIEGYDQEEIQEILNINAGNCRTLISRAKDSLRVKLQLA